MKKILFFLFTLFTVNSYADCPGMTVFVNSWNVTCNGNCDGGGVASIGGGSGNYNITYYNSSFGVVGTGGPTVANLCAGSYYIVVQDITNACIDTTQFIINSPAPLSVAINSVVNATCANPCDGSLSLTVSGGTSPYSYLWDDPSSQTTQNITGLCGGTYTVTVTDANGCVSTASATITSPNPIIVSVSPTNPTCGLCDGSIVTSSTGGVGAFTYMWSNGSTVPNQFNLCSGTYQLTVVDANGCAETAMATLSSGGIVATAVNIVSADCNQCNGSADIIATGGVGPYTYEMDSVQNTDGVFTGLCGGVHIASVADINGCTTFYTVTIGSVQTGSLTQTAVVTNESGYNMSDGSIDLTITGGVGPYTFAWNNGATTEDIFSLSNGTYGVWVTDSNGDCNYFFFTVGTVQSFGTISGFLYNDINQNCVYDVGDTPYANQYVMLSSGHVGYTNASGYYSITVPPGNYTVQPYSITNITSGCSSSQSVVVTNGNTTSNINFSFTIPAVYDVCVSVWSAGIVPGFNGSYYVYLYNTGTMTANGTLCVTLPSVLTYLGTSPTGATINNDTICINYTGLTPGSYYYLTVYFNAPASLVLGTPIVNSAFATITNGTDANPSCNQYTYTRIVTGSFDPNDKTASPAGENATGDVLVAENEFTYLVRFQNTGTGPAVNITITDTLTAMLDPLSFEMLNASHPYTVEFINGNIIRWRFENIMLPDSGSNEPGSHGHVQFRLNTANTPIVGQEIKNAANIYFDFNEPVITNTATNTFVAPNGVEEMDRNGSFSIYPNPAENLLYVKSKKGNAHYTIYDVTGKVNFTQNSTSTHSSLDISSLSSGVYFIRCISGDEVNTIKFIKK